MKYWIVRKKKRERREKEKRKNTNCNKLGSLNFLCPRSEEEGHKKGEKDAKKKKNVT